MNDWFQWNGVRCTELGIHVSEHPPITIPAERSTFTNVPGRSGSLTTLEGKNVYDDLLLTATCFITDTIRINEVISYLKGAGTVTFANRPEGFYYARIVNQIPFEKILRGNPHRSFSVCFRCKPFLYLNDSPSVNLTESGAIITNPGAVHSEPVITINGTGDITLMINSQIIELTDISGSITLDTFLMEAYNDTSMLNQHVSGEFPVFLPGNNAIQWTGNVSGITIQPNWRTM